MMYGTDMDELISIIVPVYNVAEYLKECVDSIVNQTYRNLDIILVDDGSTDGSGEMCDAYANEDDRIRVIHKENGGLSDARNAGLEIARGNYIGFIDSDDYIELDMFELLFLECKNRCIPLSCVRYDEVGKDSNDVPSADNKVMVLAAERYLINILTGNEEEFASYSACVRLYHKKILKNNRFTVGKCFEDILFSTKAILNAKECIYINKTCYHYRIRKGSITHLDTREIIPRSWITDQLHQEKEAIHYIFSQGKEELGNIAKMLWYQQALYYYAFNPHKDLDGMIEECLKQWKLKLSIVFKLPFGLRRKFIIAFKMKMPILICSLYRAKYGICKRSMQK